MCGFFGLEDVLHKEEEFACTAYKEVFWVSVGGWEPCELVFRTKGMGGHLAGSLDQSQALMNCLLEV